MTGLPPHEAVDVVARGLMPFDWFLLAVLVVGLPLWALRKFRRLMTAVQAGRPGARLSAYRNVVVVQWSLAVFLLAHWWLLDRDPVALRLDLPMTTRVLGALLVAGAGVMLLLLQLRAVQSDVQTAREAHAQLGALRTLLPHTPQEMRWFVAVSITAGVCEELLFRGYLPWFFEQSISTPLAFAVATLGFGLGHAYQGTSGILKTSVLGALLALMTWLSGSLLPSMLLHLAIDLLNGRLAYHVLRTVGATATPEDPPSV